MRHAGASGLARPAPIARRPDDAGSFSRPDAHRSLDRSATRLAGAVNAAPAQCVRRFMAASALPPEAVPSAPWSDWTLGQPRIAMGCGASMRLAQHVVGGRAE